MTGIFINYRREDSFGVAGRLCDRLSRTFSQDELFMDVDAMKPGIDFAKQIDEQVSKCAVVLAVIGAGRKGRQGPSQTGTAAGSCAH
jgi:TIR domain